MCEKQSRLLLQFISHNIDCSLSQLKVCASLKQSISWLPSYNPGFMQWSIYWGTVIERHQIDPSIQWLNELLISKFIYTFTLIPSLVRPVIPHAFGMKLQQLHSLMRGIYTQFAVGCRSFFTCTWSPGPGLRWIELIWSQLTVIWIDLNCKNGELSHLWKKVHGRTLLFCLYFSSLLPIVRYR